MLVTALFGCTLYFLMVGCFLADCFPWSVCNFSEVWCLSSRIILYTIVMANHDQDNLEVCKDVINTQAGINLLAIYHKSIGRLVLVYSHFNNHLVIIKDMRI